MSDPTHKEGDGSLPPSYFENVYANSPDPWAFETSPYEAAKYRATIEALPRLRYRRALEIGCSIGVLTQMIAGRCDSLLSVDVSEKALAAARARCADLTHVAFERRQLPAEMPDGVFDLVVISEVAYYWSEQDLQRSADFIAGQQETGAHLLLVHFTEFVSDYPMTGDQVHERWLNRREWRPLSESRQPRYRMNLLERV